MIATSSQFPGPSPSKIPKTNIERSIQNEVANDFPQPCREFTEFSKQMNEIAVKLGGSGGDDEDDDDGFNSVYEEKMKSANVLIKSFLLQHPDSVEELKKILKFVYEEIAFIENDTGYAVRSEHERAIATIRQHLEIIYCQLIEKIEQKSPISTLLMYSNHYTRDPVTDENGVLVPKYSDSAHLHSTNTSDVFYNIFIFHSGRS